MHYINCIKKQIPVLVAIIIAWNVGGIVGRYFGWETPSYPWEAIIAFCVVFVLVRALFQYKNWN